MRKLITIAVLSTGLATSAFAQSSSGPNQPPASRYNTDTPIMRDNGPVTVDPTTTQGISGGANDGTSGSSSAGTSERCAPGTPGAGNADKAPSDARKLNPSCP